MSTVADECKVLTNNKKLSREERLEKLRNVSSLLNETVKRGEEKFALAKSTYDTVCTIHLGYMECFKVYLLEPRLTMSELAKIDRSTL